jgi:AraC-like DNA-binding protein
MPFQILNAIVTIVMFGGLLLLAFVKLANPLGINRRGNFFFGLLLLLWASFWMEEIAMLAGVNDLSPLFVGVVRWSQIWAPLFLYLSIRFYANPRDRFAWNDARHLIIPFVFLLVLWLKIVLPERQSILMPVHIGLMFFQVFFYVIISYVKVKRHRKNLVRFESSIQGKDLNWLDYILVQVIIISVIALVSNVMGREAPGVLMNGVNLVVVFTVAYYAIGQKEIFPAQQALEAQLDEMDDADETETKRKLMSDEELDLIKSRLTQLMAAERPYLDSNLNLVKLAERLDLTPHKLSYTINAGYQLNFFQFVNQYRVEKAKELLLNNHQNYTVLAIAFESGFNSKTAFNTTFKKICGQTPTEFAKAHAS